MVCAHIPLHRLSIYTNEELNWFLTKVGEKLKVKMARPLLTGSFIIKEPGQTFTMGYDFSMQSINVLTDLFLDWSMSMLEGCSDGVNFTGYILQKREALGSLDE